MFSYVFFQWSQLLIQSHLICPKRKCPLFSVTRGRWGLPGLCRLYQLLCGIDDFQDFCGDVAERNSRILLFGSWQKGTEDKNSTLTMTQKFYSIMALIMRLNHIQTRMCWRNEI
jgi:hypothetical protein